MLKNLKFGTKISLTVILSVIVIITPIQSLLYNYINKILTDYSKEQYTRTAHETALQIKHLAQISDALVTPISDKLANTNHFDINAYRDITKYIQTVFKKDTNITDIWINLNPDFFSTSEEFKDLSFLDKQDQNFPVWQPNSDREVNFKRYSKVQENHFTDIYKEIKYLRKNVVSEPAYIEENFASGYFIASAKPIIINGKFAGVLGFHFNTNTLLNIINKIDVNSSGFAALVTNNGTIIAHTDNLKAGAKFSSAENNSLEESVSDIDAAIKGSYSIGISAYTKKHNADLFIVASPIRFSAISNSFSLVVGFPETLSITNLLEFNKVYFVYISIGIIILIFVVLFLIRMQFTPLKEYIKLTENVSKGLYLQEISQEFLSKKDELGKLFNTLKIMQDNLRKKDSQTLLKYEEQNKYIIGLKLLLEQMRGNQEIDALSKNVITFLSEYLDASVGTIYLYNKETQYLELTGSFAFHKRKGNSFKIKIGEGLLGQAAKEKQPIFLTEIPDDYLTIGSSLGETKARHILIAPFEYEGNLVGVIELASLLPFTENQFDFLKSGLENIAISINSAKANRKIKELYNEAQLQAEKLQAQQEELIAANEELESQTTALKTSEQKLIEQQEELQAINEELEEKTSFLEKQKAEIIKKNEELLLAQYDIAQKANEIEQASKYKSEFLANMSHELRTPLNSILILAANLFENAKGNLAEDQTEAANVIYHCGIDLLNLINDILDLSKIEAGKMNVNIQPVEVIHIIDSINKNFSKIVEKKGLELVINKADDLPKEINTDAQRLEQIIKNFISNAVKFTQSGSISVLFRYPDKSKRLSIPYSHQETIEICVKDTGIGIPKAKQKQIFEAFRQLESHLSRNYGGTGLGLSIAKELSSLLSGEIHLQSEEGVGSEFSVIIPINNKNNSNGNIFSNTEKIKLDNTPSITGSNSMKIEQSIIDVGNTNIRNEKDANPSPIMVKPEVREIFEAAIQLAPNEDDRDSLEEDDKLILIVEDDMIFAKILYEQVKNKGFKCIYTLTGEEALVLAEKYIPHAIILDIKLPGIDGWEVLRYLKENPKTRHIPVHMMSGEGNSIDAKRKGAVGFISKPTTKDKLDRALMNLENVIKKKIKDLLIVEDDERLRKSIIGLLQADDVTTFEADSGSQALQYLKFYNIDCMVLDLTLPDMTGFDLLNIIQREDDLNIPPIIVYTGKDLSKDEESKILQFAESIIIKGVKSEERLIDETALFLHRVVDKMSIKSKDIIVNLHDKDSMFKDKKVLLVDDDIRNAYAISKVMKEKGINVIIAENGEKAIEALKSEADINLVLMDVMMPVMDGLTAMGKIRNELKMKKLPIIALTAKAMKEDREKCLNAGANDYLSKPLELNKLLSLLRVWLYKEK